MLCVKQQKRPKRFRGQVSRKTKAKPSVRSVEERNALVEANLPLALWAVDRMSRLLPMSGAASRDDRISVAYLALIRAAELWEPKKAKFATYAARAMLQQLRSAIESGMENSVRLPMNAGSYLSHDVLKKIWCKSLPENCDAASDVTPELISQLKDRDQILQKAIGILAYPRRQIVTAVFLDGKGFNALAAELKLSPSQIKQHLNSGLDHLRRILEKLPREVLFPA